MIFMCTVDIVVNLCLAVQKLSFGKIGFSKAMSNKWIRLDKGHEGGPRIFRNVCVKPFLKTILKLLSRACSELGVYVPSRLGPQVDSIDDQVREKLLLVKKGNANQLEEKEKNELKKRKLLNEV